MSDVEETLKNPQNTQENEIGNISADNKDDAGMSSNNETAPENGESHENSYSTDDEPAEQSVHIENTPVQSEQEDRKPFFKASSKIVFSRTVYYLFITVFIFNVSYPDALRFYASLFLAGLCFYSSKIFRRIDRFNYIIQNYLSLSIAVFDMGITIFLIYLSGSSRNLFMLSFPALTWVYGFYGFNLSVIVIFIFNMALFFITGITFGTSDISSLNIELGFYSQLFVLGWIISIHAFSKWFRSQSDLRYEVIKMIEKLFSKLPKSVYQKIASLMSSEEVMGLKHKFKKAIEHLQLQIIERDQEIEYLKQNGVEGGGGMHDNFAVNEINSLLDIENLSLKENNKKLMELNKSLEQRVQMLVQELEIANSELERVYSSINDSQSSPEPPVQ